jgi:cyclic beta-1,2-glucan synthetase
VDTYLEWTPWIALGLAAGSGCCGQGPCHPPRRCWRCGFFASVFKLAEPPAAPGHSKLRKEELQLMRESAERIWRFFRDWSCPSTNWLIPDSVRENGEVDLRLSPTNLGMLLNARIAAVHLGVMPLAEFVFETRQTLDQVVRLPKHRGHLLNWYDISRSNPLQPLFVSTVDSGNLAASLWTLKQAAIAFASESAVKRGVTRELAEELRNIAEQCDRAGPGDGFPVPVSTAQEGAFGRL